MGFELKMLTPIMKSIMDAVFSEANAIQQATLSSIDDIYVNDNITSVAQIQNHLAVTG